MDKNTTSNTGKIESISTSTAFLVFGIAISLLTLAVLFPLWENEEIERSDWAFEMTQIDDLQNEGLSGEGVVIGIIDSGIDPDHKDLDHLEMIAWKDFINDRPEPYDDRGHGTKVAGVLAAEGRLKGAAPEVSLVVTKVFGVTGGSTGTVFADNIADSVDFCVEHGADIISMSLGGADIVNYNEMPSDRVEEACRQALDRGVFIVAAAGNNGTDSDNEDVSTPGGIDDVICVGAVGEDKTIADFSSRGDNERILPWAIDDRRDPDKKPELVAPGIKVVSTDLNNKYAYFSGTSAATPFVSGALALLLEKYPEYQRDGSQGGDREAISLIKTALMDSAEELSRQETPHDDRYGYGLLSIKDATMEL